MEGKAYTNEELARVYFIASTQNARNIQNYRRVQQAIESSPVDIHSFYKQHGGLRGLSMPGIGKKTEKTLECILKVGSESEQEREIDRLAGAAICRVSDAFARDHSPDGMARAVKENRTGISTVDRVVERYAYYTLTLRGRGR